MYTHAHIYVVCFKKISLIGHNHANESAIYVPIPASLFPYPSRSFDVSPSSMPFLLRCYYFNTVLTALWPGSLKGTFLLRQF